MLLLLWLCFGLSIIVVVAFIYISDNKTYIIIMNILLLLLSASKNLNDITSVSVKNCKTFNAAFLKNKVQEY